ncbi:MAG: iron-sulfur cluster carrier protein ApbC [Zoogloeaceae bacterium]|jgi:ATP-binding protein involved in chromosome partitioning|nr:iron-sulfur cluster carrier protein ApbC [Zoogloeaceae bacterium]
MSLTPETIRTALQSLTDPLTGKDLASSVSSRGIHIEGGVVRLDVEVGYPVHGLRAELEASIRALLFALPGVREVHCRVTGKIVAHATQTGAMQRLPEVRNIIAVASGKGGVGKSATAVNLALALAMEGARVGLLDADIHGPSLPQMLGLDGQRPVPEDDQMRPLLAYGVQVMSIGFLVEENAPIIWRSPLVTRALFQLLHETRWDNLDYLLVDMPPGTGDAQLSLAQQAPVVGAVMVTTPQDVALLDVRRGIRMFAKVGVRILGVVENMSFYVCPHCGRQEAIFGAGGSERLRAEFGVDCLGKLPLDTRIRAAGDSGRPIAIDAPEAPTAILYRDIARQLAGRIAALPKDMRAKFPPIAIEPMPQRPGTQDQEPGKT